AKPADPRGQPLEMDAFLSQPNPARQRLVMWEQIERQLVSNGDVGRVAGESGPTERPASFAEQRPDVLGNEAGDLVCVLHSRLLRLGADVVAVIEGHRAKPLQREH